MNAEAAAGRGWEPRREPETAVRLTCRVGQGAGDLRSRAHVSPPARQAVGQKEGKQFSAEERYSFLFCLF